MAAKKDRKLYSVSEIDTAVNKKPAVLFFCGEDSESVAAQSEEYASKILHSGKSKRYACSVEAERLALSEALITPDFFEPERVFIINMCGASAVLWKSVAPVIQPDSIVPGVSVIVMADRWDRLPVAARSMPQEVMVFRLWPATAGAMRKKAAGILRNSGKTIDSDALDELTARCGESIGSLDHEIQKLLACPGRNVTLEDVTALVREKDGGDDRELRFALLKALEEGNFHTALSVWSQLQKARVEPLSMLGMISSRLRLSMSLRAMMDQYPDRSARLLDAARLMGKADKMDKFEGFRLRQKAGGNIREAVSMLQEVSDIFPTGHSPLSNHPNVTASAVLHASRTDYKSLHKGLVALRDYEYGVKSGIVDSHMAFSSLVFKLCSMISE